ncbi:MAG: hypothetical protein ABWZ80_03630 [Beijerinckiaceae bacterium]
MHARKTADVASVISGTMLRLGGRRPVAAIDSARALRNLFALVGLIRNSYATGFH